MRVSSTGWKGPLSAEHRAFGQILFVLSGSFSLRISGFVEPMSKTWDLDASDSNRDASKSSRQNTNPV